MFTSMDLSEHIGHVGNKGGIGFEKEMERMPGIGSGGSACTYYDPLGQVADCKCCKY